jgi:hypothetical protein
MLYRLAHVRHQERRQTEVDAHGLAGAA